MDIGKRIKDERISKGLLQSDLANKIGVKSNTVSQYENNLKRPSYEVLIQLAIVLDVSTDYLLGKDEF